MSLVENIFCKESDTDAGKDMPPENRCRRGILVQSMGSSKGVTAKKDRVRCNSQENSDNFPAQVQPELGLVNPIPPQSFLLSRPKNFRISCNEFPSGTWFQAADPSPLVIESGQKIFALAYDGAPASALIRSFSQKGKIKLQPLHSDNILYCPTTPYCLILVVATPIYSSLRRK